MDLLPVIVDWFASGRVSDVYKVPHKIVVIVEVFIPIWWVFDEKAIKMWFTFYGL